MRDLPLGLRPGGRYEQWSPTGARYVVADVDGTLVGQAKEASAPVQSALVRTQEAGLAVGFATARMRAAAEAICPGLDVGGPHILQNGAQVWHEGASVRCWPLGKDRTKTLLALCGKFGWYCAFYTPERLFVTDRRHEAEPHWKLMGQFPNTTVEAVELEQEQVLKATVFDFTADSAGVVERLRAAGVHCIVATSPQEPDVRFVNVTHPGASKAVALAVAVARLGVHLGGVVAVGDGENDLALFEVSGTAVAMGQAERVVKAAAHLVAPAVEADGAVTALEAAIWLARQ